MATTLDNAILSDEVYKAGGGNPDGWTVIRRSDDPTNTGTYNNSGFYAVAYKNDLTGEVVIAYRGTEEALDWVNNKQILSGTVPDQFSDALTFLNEVTSRVDPLVNPISLTGHSLGGSLASLVGAYTGTTAEVFNALGTKPLLGALGLDPNANYDGIIKNHNAYFDPAYRYSSLLGNGQIGSVENVFVPSVTSLPNWLFPLFPSYFVAALPYLLYMQHNMGTILGYFTSAQSAYVTPIILDLDGDGVETLGVNAGAYFDHAGDGFAEQTGWVGADDGLLVWDRNGDGRIDDGKELFGSETILANGTKAANGYAALAELDTNLDGKVDISDTAFAALKVWKDLDGDGYSSTGELFALADVGVQSINTGATGSTYTDPNGNQHKLTGSFTKTDGSIGATADVWFQTDSLYTIQEQYLDVPADVAALPDLRGYGNVYDLQQAIVRDASGSLKSLVESFAAETNPTNRDTLFEQIVFKWTGSDTLDSASRGGNFDARKLAALEKFFGRGFVGVNGPNPNLPASVPLYGS